MLKLVVLHIIMYLAVWVVVWVGMLGWISVIYPARYGQVLVNWLSGHSPVMLPVIYGCSVYLIVVTGGEIDRMKSKEDK